MKGFVIAKKAKNALIPGTLCFIAYLAVYIARNVLSTVSSQMISDGVFDTEFVGTLSSIFFTSYAIGQLINGLIENRVKAKYMMTFGLLLSGAANYVFSLVPGTLPYSYAAYALCGFFISMIYAPMTKLVADSMEPIYV